MTLRTACPFTTCRRSDAPLGEAADGLQALAEIARLEVDVVLLLDIRMRRLSGLEVLRLMAGGLTNRQIAESLGTAEGTVKNQVSSVLAKMAVQDRMLAVLTAIDAGII